MESAFFFFFFICDKKKMEYPKFVRLGNVNVYKEMMKKIKETKTFQRNDEKDIRDQTFQR